MKKWLKKKHQQQTSIDEFLSVFDVKLEMSINHSVIET